MSKIFDTNDVVVLKVDLMSFLLKMDIDDMGQPLYPLELFTEELISVIPEYVFAEYETSNISQVQVVQKLREAAKSIYKIKSPAFRVLLEYGVPDNAVRVIQNVLRQQAKVSDDMPEEELFHLIKINKKILETMLGRYELDIIEKLI